MEPRYYVSILLPNGTDRPALIKHFIGDLGNLPFDLKIQSPEHEIMQQLSSYEAGTSKHGRLYRGMALELVADISGKKRAQLHFEEITGEVIMVDFIFDAAGIRAADRAPGKDYGNQDTVHSFQTLLLALNNVYPVLIGTVARDLTASDILGIEDGDQFTLAGKLSFEQLGRALYEPGSDYAYDFALINPAASGASKPFVYSLIGYPEKIDTSDGRTPYHDLEVIITELRLHRARAELAYDRMYDSSTPKDEKDDALGHLSKATALAHSLGLSRIEADLRSRGEHINDVFKAQFRR